MKTLLSILAFGFAISIYWALSIKPISESADFFFTDPWGIVSLIDLYIGFFLFILFMLRTLPKKTHIVFWAPTLLILGNIVSLGYVVFYFNHLTTKRLL
jgi:hypothetical protein